jgi:N-carbamoyl-L-amino-acid hydrolase
MDNTQRNLKINEERLWVSLMDMAKIGPGIAGGNNRQTLTDEDSRGRALLKEWCDAAGCQTGIDQMGNMFTTREGTNEGALPVYVGSHLDTQPTGGKFDGVLGVLAGLELIRTLNDHNIKTKHPIVVANWTNEEGTRFTPSMLGSGVFTGRHAQSFAYDLKDKDGKSFGGELERIGWKGAEPVGARKMHAYFELHIEQGPVLEANDIEIGVVTHGQGQSWTEITILGQEAHTGSTPMRMRKNAGLGMAHILALVDEIALSYEPHAVGAVGHIDVFPNSKNVIPGKVIFTVDFRSPSLPVIEKMEQRLAKGAQIICSELGLDISMKKVGGFDPVQFDEACVSAVRDAAKAQGYSHMDLISGAGHDACWINAVAPTAMIMCPCVDGLSHNEAEDITQHWAGAGANVLFHAVLATAIY